MHKMNVGYELENIRPDRVCVFYTEKIWFTLSI